MVLRNIPCKECRKRRRKCVRNSLYEICSRCRHLKKRCSDSDEESDEEPYYNEYDEDVLLLQKQVDELNLLLKEMEKQTNRPSTLDENNMQLIAKSNACNNKPWNLTFHNGILRIETGICSISDLLVQCSPTWYLSPFPSSSSSSSSTNEDGFIVQFDPGKTIRFMPLTIKLLLKCITPVLTPSPFLSPAAFDIDAVVDRLVNVYFQCRNTHTPLVHERTFMEHYRGLRSPLDSLVCLSICCSVCAIPCNHTMDDPYKFRQLGDFFYDLAKRKLMNQFDETSKRLENLICINLLNGYMLTVLRLEDFKNLVTMGFRICLDLGTWFETTQGNAVERMLYGRHFFTIFLAQGLLSLITKEPMHHLSTPLPEWIVVDDEPKEVSDFIAIKNHLLRLYNHPYIANVKMQIQYQLRGDPFSLKFDSIIRMDDVLREWWKSVPLQYQICEDWLNLEEAKAGIDKCKNDGSLILFNLFLAFMMDIYSALLQPSALGTNNDQILSVVQELSLKRSVHSCQLLIYSQFRSILLSDTLFCHSILNISEYLFHTLDAIIVMVFSTNCAVRTAAKEMLVQSQSLIDHVLFMQCHQIDPDHSPLLASARVNDINSIDLSEYYKYPQPWYAMIYDIVHHLDKVHISSDEETALFSNFP